MRQTILISLVLLGLTGCAASRQVDSLESRLRQQEEELLRLSQELQRSQTDLAAARQDANTLRTQLTSSGKTVIPVEQAEMFYRISAITIDRMQSSFLVDEKGGGEFAVQISPVDQLQAPLRVPGEITLKVLHPENPAALPLLERQFTGKDVKRSWNDGWVSSGFLLQLPWSAPAMSAAGPLEKVIVEAVYTTVDNRQFTARQEMTLGTASPQQIQQATHDESQEPQLVPIPIEFRQEPTGPMHTSDRRTLDEFPLYR